MSSGDYLGLEEWSSFYEKDYKRVGLVAGTFYDGQGQPTQHRRDLLKWIEQAHRDRDKEDVEKALKSASCLVPSSGAHRAPFWTHRHAR